MEEYDKGEPIKGLEKSTENSIIFHAGTKQAGDQVVTNGGRVLAVTGIGENMKEALDSSYDLVSKIHWNNVYFRKDIGYDLMRLE